MRSRSLLMPIIHAGLAASLLAGCVYYNGMYNANRLARSARKAEREGRTFDATNLWGQVATKAESVVVRHPDSKYAGEAAILRGVAQARMGQCDQALGSLSRFGTIPVSGDLTEEALVATGRCQIVAGNMAAADAAFSQLLESKNPERRREAHLQHARLLRQTGRYQAALDALAGIRGPKADNERILSLAGTGQVPKALALVDSVIARGDTTQHWDSVLVALGRQNPGAASSVVDRVNRLPRQTPALQGQLLLEDGLRLTPVDSARATRRFQEAIALGAAAPAAGPASLALVRLNVSRVVRPEDLGRAVETLKGVGARFTAVSTEAAQLAATIAEIQVAGDSVTFDTPQGDLRLFLAAELARDSLQAPRLAQALWRSILDTWPASPYAPKAVLAVQQLDPTWADSARALLEEQYLDSPYLAMIRGEAGPEYRQLEDSLGSYAAALATTRAGAVRRRPAIDDDDRIRARLRRPPTAGGTRVPEAR
jgi:tetratricopeptide (TPR) repeat protein